MPVSFDSVVAEQLPKVINCTTRKDFEEILARLVATLEDTHAFSFYRQLNYKKDIFHAAHYPPFEYKVFKDHILVTSIISPAVCSKANIRPGDKIIAINNQKVTGLIAEKSKLLSVSNKEVLVYRLSDYLSNLIWNNDSLTNSFTVLSGGKEKKVTVEFISMADKNGTKEINEYFQRKQTEKKKPIEDTAIAYFNISNTFHFISDIDDDKVDAKMDEILGEASTKKAIVFDMRAYPDWGGFVHTYIYKYFSEKNNYYHRIYFPNPKNIGTWEYQKRSLEYFPDIPGKTRHVYKGKVFILVNPETLSASELYTMSLQHIFPGSITIGQTTAGADGNIKTMNLPGGYAFSFTGLSVLYPNSSLTQKVGIKINTYISYSNEDILMKRDKEMEKVMELLK